MSYGIAIIGGGLAGLSLLRALVKQGVASKDLLLLEQLTPASGSSGVTHGMMHPFTGRTLYPKPGYLESWKFSLEWLSDLQAETEIPLYRTLPLWRIALEKAAENQFERSFLRAQTVPEYPMYRVENLNVWPLKDILAGYALDCSAQVNMPALIAHMSAHSNVTQHYHTGKVVLRRQSDRWQIKTSQGLFYAQEIVLATGSGLRDYFPKLDLLYARGEVALFRLPGLLPAAISGGGRYAASLKEGLHITGATLYDGDRPWSVDCSWQDLQAGLHWWPEVQAAQLVQVWSGVRAIVNKDREPLAGPVPEQSHLWMHVCYSTRGLLQIPLASWRLAEEIISSQKKTSEHMRPERLDGACWEMGSLVHTL